MLKSLIAPPPGFELRYDEPKGAAALIPYQGVMWQVLANPLTLYIGGIAAVILELAEPSVRSGVWDHSSFRSAPLLRMRRTGHAALIGAYAPRAEAEALIARVVKIHNSVSGQTPTGQSYHANDPRLLTWVHATALAGFAASYHHFYCPLTTSEHDQMFAEGYETARLYGANTPPRSQAEWQELLQMTALEDHPILDEFLTIMEEAPILPKALRPLQRLIARAAVEITPPAVRDHFPSLQHRRLKTGEATALRWACRLAPLATPKDYPPKSAAKRFT